MGNRITVTCHWLSEKAMAPHSSTLAWKIPRVEEPGRLYSPWGRKESDTTERLHFHFSLSRIGEGNGNPLQCSCLENPRDWRTWWAADMGLHRVGHAWSDLAAVAAAATDCGSAGKESTCNVGDLGSIPGLGRSPGEGKGYPLQYSGVKNSMGCIVHGITKSRTRLRNFHSPLIRI